jgi:ABC-type polysaccharide/polyol phosphate export permease
MQRRSTFWFILAAAWFVLLLVNLWMHHRDLNTLVISIAVAVFLVIGVIYRSRETKALRGPRIKP